MRTCLDDARYWRENGTYVPLEAATRFHHRLVWIHPFANGNERWGAVVADSPSTMDCMRYRPARSSPQTGKGLSESPHHQGPMRWSPAKCHRCIGKGWRGGSDRVGARNGLRPAGPGWNSAGPSSISRLKTFTRFPPITVRHAIGHSAENPENLATPAFAHPAVAVFQLRHGLRQLPWRRRYRRADKPRPHHHRGY